MKIAISVDLKTTAVNNRDSDYKKLTKVFIDVLKGKKTGHSVYLVTIPGVDIDASVLNLIQILKKIDIDAYIEDKFYILFADNKNGINYKILSYK